MAGFGDTAPEEAQLLFAAEGPEIAEAFARADPYVANGLVTAWRTREWITVVGGRARRARSPEAGFLLRTGHLRSAWRADRGHCNKGSVQLRSCRGGGVGVAGGK